MITILLFFVFSQIRFAPDFPKKKFLFLLLLLHTPKESYTQGVEWSMSMLDITIVRTQVSYTKWMCYSVRTQIE